MSEVFAIIETKGELDEVYIANEDWITADGLLWPPKSQSKIQQRKFLKLIPADNWNTIRNFTILQRQISNTFVESFDF